MLDMRAEPETFAKMLIDRDTKRCEQCKQMYLPRISTGVMADSGRWIMGGEAAKECAYYGSLPFRFEIALRSQYDELPDCNGPSDHAAHLWVEGVQVIANINHKGFCMGRCYERAMAGKNPASGVPVELPNPAWERFLHKELRDLEPDAPNNRAGRRGAVLR